ncbi:MAG: ABC transporter ATP-binding protein [Oscillospiraceae bacterium]|nr:ABC transporter ATP-binding protein [Oscillospiraceae bacterium]
MKFLINYLKPFKWRMLLGFSIKVSGTVAELFLPYILTHILDNVIGTLRVEKVVFFGVLMIICAALACAGNITANRMAAKVSRDFSKKMRRDLFAKTLYLSSSDTDRFTVPSLESRITTDTYNVHNFVSMMQRMGVRAPILLIGGLGISFFMDSTLALVMLATLPFIFITVYSISRNGVPLYSKVQNSVDKMVRVVREDTQGIRVIKALSKNDYENRRYDAVNLGLSKDERRAGIIMGSVNPIMMLLMNLGITAVVALSAFTVAKGISTPATVIAFVQYFTLISMAMMVISRIFVMYTKCAASAGRIAEVLETPDNFYVTEDNSPADDKNFISFENVSFSYLGKKNNIENLSVSVPKGGTLGIIGATGSGKSTLIKLLMRSYEATGGKIKIGGRDITSYNREALTSMFGVALQNDFLYADSIAENIRFGRDISDEDIKRAADIAQASDFIEALPEGYDHVIAPKGTNLSGGQKQRLLIARAVAARPDIIILDDSSSALDYKTDAALRKALDSELSGSTVITVAQRVSSVKNCERILVLDDGKVIGNGTHEELLESCREYREISDSQMGGAFVD